MMSELEKRIDRALVQIENHIASNEARIQIKKFSASDSELMEIKHHTANIDIIRRILKGEL